MEGDSHKISAALRSRGLIKTSGHGARWRAQLTDAGRSYHAHPPPVRQGRQGGDLRGAHRFVTATRDAAVGRRAAQDGRISIGPRAGVVHMGLNRELLRRALLIAHAVIGEAERRGWEVTSDQGLAGGSGPRGVAVVVGAHAYPIEIHEVTETVPFTEEEIRAWRAEDRWDLYHREGKLPPPQRKRKSRVYVREAPGPLRPEDRTGSLSMAVPGHVCGADRRRPRGMEFSGVSLS
jgi:hypothetical protein